MFKSRVYDRGMEQLVARWAHNPKVTGSSPVPATRQASTLSRGFFYALNFPFSELAILLYIRSMNVVKDKGTRLFIFLAGFFVCNALVAEFIGVKIFSLERTLGIYPYSIDIFGIEDLSFNLSAGVLLWPFVFVMTDVINEYFGVRGVRLLSWLTVGLIAYAFIMIFFTIQLTPADFWPASKQGEGIEDYNLAFSAVYSQGMWIIVGSLVAFLVGQLVDVTVFHQFKRWTGEKGIWIRATGSTVVSQLIDSFVVLFIAFYIGAGWDIQLVFAIGLIGYIYKFLMAVVTTPLIYFFHMVIDRYLGEEKATEMKKQAMGS